MYYCRWQMMELQLAVGYAPCYPASNINEEEQSIVPKTNVYIREALGWRREAFLAERLIQVQKGQLTRYSKLRFAALIFCFFSIKKKNRAWRP